MKKDEADKELVVFSLITETKCAECGDELERGELLFKQGEKGLCLACADLDHLVYLHRGDPALTRRAKKYSGLHAVVVRWSRARKRYERQGLLVEEAALARAEAECEADAPTRALRAAAAQERAAELDQEYIRRFAAEIRKRYPGCLAGAEAQIAAHACRKYSGRVGRGAAAKSLDEKAIDLAVQAHVRHVHTRYDEFLMRGIERYEARDAIRADVLEIMEQWRGIPKPPRRESL